VVERLGHVLWPCYPLTGGAPLFVDRRALLAWEALADAPDTTPPEALLAGLTRGHAAGPAGLDRERPLARRILELAEGLERGDAPRARALYDGVAARVPRYAARAGLRAALLSEREGHPAEALQRLATLRPLASGPDRLAVNRSGRRLARELRRGWAPDPPAPPIRERSVALPPAERVGARPLWAAGLTVEAAVAEVVARAGRSALRAEGGPWIALFTSIFAGDTWFLPVDGVLPVPRLSGPLDVGTPAFAVRRPEAVGRVMHAVQAGRAPDLVRATQSRFGGRRLAGLRGPCPSDEVMPALAEALGPALLCAVFGPLLARGWSAASGLPDLLVLPGPPVVLPDVVASRLDGSARLVEVKGPGDTLSDRQRHWLAELAPLGVVEVWNVRPISATGVGPGTPSQPPSSTRTPPAP
jgi:hypothetical protein